MLKEPEFRSTFMLAIITLAFGTIAYHLIEGWRWLDSLYFSVMTLTTIGYGDLVPVTDSGKIFTIIYVFMGLGILLALINATGEHFRKHQKDIPSLRAQNFLWDSGNSLQKMERDILENIQDDEEDHIRN
ncbi:potassium channel family protein [Methanolobus sp. WCC4]|uniref:potassium channel family protein n=1 Tax=Methanolobus sp. WCC4 TaxID=3125784 RepID=UPI0030F7B3B3